MGSSSQAEAVDGSGWDTARGAAKDSWVLSGVPKVEVVGIEPPMAECAVVP